MFFSKRENCIALLLLAFASSAHAAACVWRVTGPRGETLYLGGSVHALRSVDYPLPPEYNRAFDASSRLAFEIDAEAIDQSGKELLRAGKYPKGDSLKNHVDPRAYDYFRRLFALMHVPEEKFGVYRPWMLSFLLHTSGSQAWSGNLGVERFLTRRAKANHKPIAGLESTHEHIAVFADMTDAQAEATLLITLLAQEQTMRERVDAWRRGDVEFLARSVHDEYRDYPAIGTRLLDDRNRRWIPRIEGYLASGQTYFVVAGAAHLGGPNGLLALLRARGYQLEQL